MTTTLTIFIVFLSQSISTPVSDPAGDVYTDPASPTYATVLTTTLTITPTPTYTVTPTSTLSPSQTATATPVPPSTATPVLAAYYVVQLPSGGEAHVVMEFTAGEAAIVMVLSLLTAVTIFDVVRRMVRSSSIR